MKEGFLEKIEFFSYLYPVVSLFYSGSDEITPKK
jgi:hypothetical protein